MKHNNILKYNHNQDKKSMKIPSVIYVDTESLLEKKCDNDPEKPSLTKISKYTPCGCSIYTHCSFGSNKNKHDFYIGEDPMKKFCADFREHATKIIN